MTGVDDSPVLVLHHQHGPGLQDALAAVAGFELISPGDDDGVREALAGGAEGLITYAWRDFFLDHRLRWIQAISAGTDQFPFDQLRQLGVVLTSARGAHSPAVADHAVALLFGLLRRLGPAIRRSVEHRWQPEMAHETEGLIVGIVGLGSIGEQIAQRLTALGMEVIGAKRKPEQHGGVINEIVSQRDLLDLFRRCDAVIVALPSNPDTDLLIGSEHLAALESGWLVNVGRGSVIDEDALIDVLRSGRLRGAGLDVTATEPLPDDSPLWDLPQVIITPHMAWASQRLSGRLATLVEANVSALKGQGAWVNRVV